MAAESHCWFLTGSQGLYGPETFEQVERQSQQIVDQLNESGQLPLQVQWQPVLTDSEAIHRVMLEANADSSCLGVIAWLHTFSPAKMWSAGSVRCRCRCCTRTPRPMQRCPGRRSTWTS
jgi:L-arabinose isomerase